MPRDLSQANSRVEADGTRVYYGTSEHKYSRFKTPIITSRVQRARELEREQNQRLEREKKEDEKRKQKELDAKRRRHRLKEQQQQNEQQRLSVRPGQHTPRVARSRIASQLKALNAANRQEKLITENVDESVGYLKSLSRGQSVTERSWEQTFRSRNGREPTRDERGRHAQLAQEEIALRRLRHQAASANVDTMLAERALMVKERTIARRAVRRWMLDRSKGPAAMPPAASERVDDFASHPVYVQLREEVASYNREIKRIDKRIQAAKGREVAWPGVHWQRAEIIAASNDGLLGVESDVEDDEMVNILSARPENGVTPTGFSYINMLRRSGTQRQRPPTLSQPTFLW